MKHLFEALYKSEINLHISWFWDAGFDVKIGDEMNGYLASFSSYDLFEIEKWIEQKAKELFPDSKFSKTYNGDDFDSAVEPAIRYLLRNHNPHTKIHIDYDIAELLQGQRSHNLTDEIPD